MKKLIKGLVSSMIDGVKDGQMFYDYAKMAKEHEKSDLATYFLMRAKTRLQMVNEDNNKLEDCLRKMEMEGSKDTSSIDPYKDYFVEQKEKLEYCIQNFK